MEANTDSVALSEYGRMARRRWLTVAVCLIFGLALAVAYFAYAPKQYSATSTVVVYPITTNNFSQVNLNQTVNATTEASIVASTTVARQAAQLIAGNQSPTLLLQDVQAVGAPNTQTVTITFTASTAAGAAQGSNAFANAYLTTRQAAASQQIQTVTSSMIARIVALEKEVAAANAAVAGTPPASAVYNNNLVQRQVLTQELIQLQRDLSSLSTLAIVPGQLVSEATSPTKPTSPSPLIALAGGLALALLLAMVLVYARDRTDDRLRDAEHARSALDAPVLAIVSPPHRRRRGADLRVAEIDDDDYRAMAVKLATKDTGSVGCVAVVGVDEKPEGIVAAGLATALARSGARTTLVVATASRAILGLLDDVPTRPLHEAFIGEPSRTADGQPSQDIGVFVAWGATPIGSALSLLVHDLRTQYGSIIVILPGDDIDAETLAWARLADSVVLVGSLHHTRARRFAAAVEQLTQVGAVVCGCVLVRRRGPGRMARRRQIKQSNTSSSTSLRRAVSDRRSDQQLVMGPE